eukprot:m.25787 g.25787  ORF g.25787 m.25787 type:complete len:120 (-) comp8762_c0_seq1:433-792(-)
MERASQSNIPAATMALRRISLGAPCMRASTVKTASRVRPQSVDFSDRVAYRRISSTISARRLALASFVEHCCQDDDGEFDAQCCAVAADAMTKRDGRLHSQEMLQLQKQCPAAPSQVEQ